MMRDFLFRNALNLSSLYVPLITLKVFYNFSKSYLKIEATIWIRVTSLESQFLALFCQFSDGTYWINHSAIFGRKMSVYKIRFFEEKYIF